MTKPNPVAGSLRGSVWAAIAVVIVGLNLRPAIVAVAPVFDVLRVRLELNSFLAGALVTLPVLCFGVLGPMAPALARRIGFEKSLALVLLAIIGGCGLRLIPTSFGLFSGTLLLGAGIAIGNILLPGLIKRDFAHKLGIMSGLFSACLSAGATLAAGVTLPIANAAGWEWNEALAFWGIFAVFGLACWLPFVLVGDVRGKATHTSRIRLGSDRIAWLVTAFFGLQSLNFYSTTAWLPTILIDGGHDPVFAGLMLSLVNLVSIPPALAIPMFLDRLKSQAGFAIAISVVYFAAFGGMLFYPQPVVLWMVLLGIAQGAGLGVGLTLIVLRTKNSEQATVLSGMAQSWGYLFAAAGPLALGALRDATGSWQVPLTVLFVALVPMLITGYLGGKPGFVRPTVASLGTGTSAGVSSGDVRESELEDV